MVREPAGDKSGVSPRQVAPAPVCPRAALVAVLAPARLPPLPPLEALLSETGATNPTSTTVSQALGPVLLSKAFARVRTVALVAIALSALVAD